MIHKTVVPDKRTINISFTVPENYVGEEMEIIAFIKNEGLEKSPQSEYLSPALKGPPMSNKEFVEWIREAENSPTISLEEAKERWAKSRNIIWEDIK